MVNKIEMVLHAKNWGDDFFSDQLGQHVHVLGTNPQWTLYEVISSWRTRAHHYQLLETYQLTHHQKIDAGSLKGMRLLHSSLTELFDHQFLGLIPL
jgi:hypothetical protein